ncbi:CHAT domain-containing protein [Lentzea sp. NBRC 105346]|uniref:CHAT domain-containing protein n=1 Tax=Lentzea sp. NBRC 105346 TaxID=3032205 RepID=UPI0024A0098A|nr:CHAT domain-containing tetratricopeptide repeat protein [Lentzea sp. NBRC 105346]GLZ28574.1 CHAT domain-containing protein [Lentzea sp. NBRC 105346]
MATFTDLRSVMATIADLRSVMVAITATPEARARELHARGRAAIEGSRSAEGIRLFRVALGLLNWPDAEPRHHEIAARVLISMAAAEVHLGRSDTGFGLLDDAEKIVAPRDRGLLLSQRGLLCMLTGRMDDALGYLNEGIPQFQDDPYGLATALLNRAMLHDLAGRARFAVADLDRCEAIAGAAGLPLVLAKARLNRGYSELLMGDVPAALRSFDLAKPGFVAHAHKLLPVLAVDKARALMQAGLADEAAAELDEAIRLLGHARPTYERAEAALTRAQAAVVQGDFPAARTWARRAERCFLSRGDRGWAAVAVLTRLRADFRSGRRLAAIAAEAAALVPRLRGLGLTNDAEIGSLLAARACIRRGRLDDARRFINGRSAYPALETVLMRRVTAAELHAATGDTGRVFRSARAGLAVLDDHRSRLGSLDLRTGSAALGVELAAIGLATAVRHSTPPVIFAWSERSRAQAFLLPPVRPPADRETSDAVAELRQLAVVVRTAELAGRPSAEARRRCAELEHVIRARGWTTNGNGQRTRLAGFHDVADALGSSVMVSFLAAETDLLGVVIVDGASTLVRFGPPAEVTEAITRLRTDLDALCGHHHPSALLEVIGRSVHHQLALLRRFLIAPMISLLGDRDLVVVPTGALSGVPWGLLMPGRPVSVTPSASVWLHGRFGPPASGALLVAGPDLEFAPAEVASIAGLLPGSTVLVDEEATVDSTLKALCGKRVAHFAAHGHHEPGNILFSRLDLADGPLMAHDISTLASAPEHVVLSSCDTGRSEMRAGDEMLGFAAAFLYSGTRTVVAGVARVPDDTVVPVMTAYHSLLLGGATPAAALAEASLSAPLIPLVCFGSR